MVTVVLMQAANYAVEFLESMDNGPIKQASQVRMEMGVDMTMRREPKIDTIVAQPGPPRPAL